MVRPRTPIGMFGEIESPKLSDGTVRARRRFRDHDGRLRRVEASGDTRKSAEHRLKEKLSLRGVLMRRVRATTPGLSSAASMLAVASSLVFALRSFRTPS